MTIIFNEDHVKHALELLTHMGGGITFCDFPTKHRDYQVSFEDTDTDQELVICAKCLEWQLKQVVIGES